jgi:cephalosporin hydroxylase
MIVEPDFNRDRWAGQMNPSERQLLFNLITNAKPDVVCEVGTCRGGGSTYFIARALANNEKGMLYTCETNKEFYDFARNLFATDPDFKGLEEYVEFNLGSSYDVFTKRKAIGFDNVLESIGSIDVCLLDGGADRLSIVYDFAMFRPYIPVGKYLVVHDWEEKDYDKCKVLREVLNEDKDWKMIYRAIELVVFQRVADTHMKDS